MVDYHGYSTNNICNDAQLLMKLNQLEYVRVSNNKEKRQNECQNPNDNNKIEVNSPQSCKVF